MCWKMTLDTDKSVLMRMTHKKSPLLHTYKLGSSPLHEVTQYKYLGVTFNNMLTWNDHISNTCTSAFRKLCLLRHKLKKAPSDVKLLCYNTLIRTKLEYACIVWDPYTKTNINNLERVQRKAVRFIFNKFSRFDSPTELMKTNHIEPLEMRRQKKRVEFLKLLHTNNSSLDSSLYLSPLLTRPTRHHRQDALTPYFARTNIFKNSFFPRTITE